jgi:hypothetical protein
MLLKGNTVADTACVDVPALSDDEFGKLFLQHNDPTHRDPEVWQVLSDIRYTERAHRVLETMKHVNTLALHAHKETLEEFKANRLTLYRGDADPGLKLSRDSEWLEERARFEQWHHRSKRFAQRVHAALSTVEYLRRDAGYHNPVTSLWKLIDAVNDYLDEHIDEGGLEKIADHLTKAAYADGNYSRPTRIWAPCEIAEDGLSIFPRWNEWFDDRDQAVKAVRDAPGTVLGTTLVSVWTRAENKD